MALLRSTATRSPCWLVTTSFISSHLSSKPRLYENPLHPPPATPIRKTVDSGNFFSDSTRFISPTAFSVITTMEGEDTEDADTEDADTEGADTEGADTEGADTEGADTEGSEGIVQVDMTFKLLARRLSGE